MTYAVWKGSFYWGDFSAMFLQDRSGEGEVLVKCYQGQGTCTVAAYLPIYVIARVSFWAVKGSTDQLVSKY